MATESFPEYGRTWSTLPETITIPGRIVTHNTTPTIAAGKGFKVAKNGTGVYKITLNKKMGRIISAVGIYCNEGTARILKKKKRTDGDNFVEFLFENTSGAATEPGATDEFEFVIVAMRIKLPQV
jgi:hypothetical protein